MSQVTKRPALQPQMLEAICKTIADTNDGLTGSEISKILGDCQIKDIDPANTKWKRLYNAFVTWQNQNLCSNHILKFIQQALQPVRYIGKEEVFQHRRNEINKRLYFIGTELAENGKFRLVETATTITEAEQRASKYKYKLEARSVHSEIFKYCSAELLVENYFHSVFEAVKSIADRIRNLTGLSHDGNQLAEMAFSTDTPRIRINDLQTSTDRSEHVGLSNIIKGMFGIIRNPTAHEPRLKFTINEEEALDIMTTISYIHKKLDNIRTS